MLYDDQDYVNNVEKVRDRVFIIYPGGMPVKLPLLNYYRGDRFSLTLIGRNIDNTPFDFTGAELTLQIKKDPDCEEFLGELSSFNNYLLEQSEDGRAYDIEQGNALDTTLDIITLFDPLGEFTTINEEIVFHDLQMNYFDTIITIVRGFFRIIKDVTRKPVFVPDPEPVILPKTYVKPTNNTVTLSGSLGFRVPPPKLVGLSGSVRAKGYLSKRKVVKIALYKSSCINYSLDFRRITKYIVSLNSGVTLDGYLGSSVNLVTTLNIRLNGTVRSNGSIGGSTKIKTRSLSKSVLLANSVAINLEKGFIRSLSKSVLLANSVAINLEKGFIIGLYKGFSVNGTTGTTINQ